jgi:hypothetical protein
VPQTKRSEHGKAAIPTRAPRTQPIEKIGKPLVDVVDAESGNLHSEAYKKMVRRSDAANAGTGSAPLSETTSLLDVLALLGGHHVDVARHKRHFLASALGARRLLGFMLGDGLAAFKLLPALIATILVGGHGSNLKRAAACRAFMISN